MNNFQINIYRTVAEVALTTSSFEGLYEINDTLHPNGGSVEYVNASGVTVIRNGIYSGDCIAITYQTIINETAVSPC